MSKKEYIIVFIIIIFTYLMSLFRIPLEKILSNYIYNTTFISKIIIRIILIFILLYVIKKLGLLKFNGLNIKNFQIRDKYVLVIPFLLIVVLFILKFSVYKNSNIELLLIVSLSVLATGFFEELWMRGLILPLFIQSQKQKKYKLYYGVILSAFVFGGLHYVNLFKEPSNFIGITSQVFYAFAFGVLMGALMLRTGNVIVLSIFHALINFTFSTSIFEEGFPSKISESSAKMLTLDFYDIILNSIVIIFIIIISLNMIRKVDKSKIEYDLQYYARVL